MSLYSRRRALMSAASSGPTPPPPEWDSVWDFSDGLPTVAGWTRTTSGGTCSLVTNGLNLRKNSYEKDIDISNGVIEAKFIINNERSTMAENRAWLRIGNASNAIYVVFKTYNTHHIRLYDNSLVQNGTDLGTFTLGDEYTLKLTINGSVGVVEVNGVVVKDDVNTASILSKGPLKFGSDGQYGGSTWQYVKYKKVS